MHLNPRALVALQAVIRDGTVTAAARRIHRTQPVASRLLAQLETQVGFSLFRREGKRLVPTAEGLSFYREAERALAALTEIEASASDIRQRRALPLRILAQPHMVYGLLPVAFEEFGRGHPEVRFSLEIRQREHISHWIANLQFDVGFAPQPLDHPQVQSEPLVSAPLFAVMPSAHALAAKARIAAADLAAQSLVTTHPGAPVRSQLDRFLSSAGVAANIRVETVNGFSACQLAARGLGIALADPFVAGFFAADPSVAVRPLSPAVELEYSVLRPRGLGTSALVQEFVECVRRHANGVIGRLVKTTARDAGGSSRRASRSLPGRGREQRLSRR